MVRYLELLAPARNADIGIAAIDCGADAVYVAGPAFGARQAAGNPMEDIRRLTEYAHRFGVRIFLTLNTILYDNELAAAERILKEAKEAGVDAVIAQDPAVWRLTDLPVHASTQCAVRTPEKALLYESLGASRLVLEREMSLEQVKAVREAVGCELEFFVHGALCVCYSGQCYLSERIAGRSANRGECIQACRSLYDLVDESGKVLARNKALLSLKDYNLKDRLSDLAEAGICSFKIEGRLKSASYVRNVTRAYSLALDELVAAHPEKYCRSSFGRVEGGFTPDLGKTFNRGYTQLFLDGKRSGGWSSMDAPKSIGEEIGTVVSVSSAGGSRRDLDGKSSRGSRFDRFSKDTVGGDITITVRMKNPAERLRNGDGFSFIAKGRGDIVGFRGDVCQGNRITCRDVQGLYPGARLYRNLSAAFEKELEANLPVRRIPVTVDVTVTASPDAGHRTVSGSVTDSVTDSVTEPVEVVEVVEVTKVTEPRHPALRQTQRPDTIQQHNIAQRPDGYQLKVNAVSEDGRVVSLEREAGGQNAENADRMRGMFATQISKATGIYSFTLRSFVVQTPGGEMPFLPASALNAIRRDIAAALEKRPLKAVPLLTNPNRDRAVPATQESAEDSPTAINKVPESGAMAALAQTLDIQENSTNSIHLSYKANVANHIARETYSALGASDIDEAFELSHRPDTELMRTKYCIRFELGLCPVRQLSAKPQAGRGQSAGNNSADQRTSAAGTVARPSSLYLTNNGKRYKLLFDCARCEMVVKGENQKS